MIEPLFEVTLAVLVASLRILALFTAAPLFGHSAVPVRVRVAFAVVVSAAVAPSVELPLGSGSVAWGGLVLQESLIGLALGFSMRLIFAAFDLLGEFVSIQGGLGAATVVDPASGASSLALATTLQTFMLLVFLAMDGHHDVVRAAAHSYAVLPPGGGLPAAGAFLGIAKLGGEIFAMAARLAAPFTVAMLVSNIAVGIMGRAIPQLNLMMLQLPAHVAMTLGLLLLGAGTLVDAARGDLAAWPERSLGLLVSGRE